MPLYPYRCTKCGHRFEKIQSFSSEPETKCPECGGVLERPLTAPGLQFKGAGWYVTDYASKSGGSSSESTSTESKAPAESKTSSENKTSSESKTSAADKPGTPAAAPSAPASKSSESKS